MAAAPSLADEKRALRRVMGQRRDMLTVAERTHRSATAVQRLLGVAPFASARVVAGFAAARSEIDPGAALDAARAGGAVVALPRVDAESGLPRLRFHRVQLAADLQPGKYGILEPAAACPQIELADVDVFVVPGLAFDRAGRRLGYGGGYYDELAMHLRVVGLRQPLIGFAFDVQIVDQCPAGEGDVPVDWVVTDAQVIRSTSGQPETKA